MQFFLHFVLFKRFVGKIDKSDYRDGQEKSTDLADYPESENAFLFLLN